MAKGMSPLTLTRERIQAFRRRVGGLDARRPFDPDALRSAAWAGLQDSMPRAALLSLHARVEGITSQILDDPFLVQVWGPRYSVFVVAGQDRAIFTLARLPDDGRGRHRAIDLADRLDEMLAGREMRLGEAGRALGESPNRLRYATATGRMTIRWDGARQPTIWMVEAPDIEPHEARVELARRHLHVFGPSTVDAFAKWAGISKRLAEPTFAALETALVPVRTPIGDAFALARDEDELRRDGTDPAPARLLPSGDAYYLLHGEHRGLLVDDPGLRDRLWTSRVWPGAVLVEGRIVGTWRRAQHRVTVEPWERLSGRQRTAIEAEAASMPLPGLDADITVEWEI